MLAKLWGVLDRSSVVVAGWSRRVDAGVGVVRSVRMCRPAASGERVGV